MRAASVDEIKVGRCKLKTVQPMLKASRTQRLTLKYDEHLSRFAFRYIKATRLITAIKTPYLCNGRAWRIVLATSSNAR
jgi:hypothetical protein